MAHNEYYTFHQKSVNGQIMMSVQVFDEITKTVVACSIKENEVYINIHVRIKYGTNIAKVTKEIQEKIATAVKQMTGVDVKHIDIQVDNIDFE